jgi:2,3-bisphosphoglycerate-dependent phosphoglycerate mutase
MELSTRATIERVDELPRDLDPLVRESVGEGLRLLERLRDGWRSGGNRFDRPGEALFSARIDGRLAGIGGLNRDPYQSDPFVGRVRHLYVDPRLRRRGIGAAIVGRVLETARGHFARVRVRTNDPDAAALYETLGFVRVSGVADSTHEIELAGRALLLVRHCEATGPPANVLTETGRAQAVALASRLAPLAIDHVVSSPYARARATIEPFSKRSGLPIHIDERLAERTLSAVPTDAWREAVRRSFVDLDARLPGGESGREVLARGWAALHALLAEGHRLPVAVSHGQLMSLVLHSIDAGFGHAGWESLRNPDVILLESDAAERFRFRRLEV